jgi:SAM-dependent methyltransferase
MSDDTRAQTCRACGKAADQPVGEKNGFNLVGCQSCGSLQVSPFPSEAELAEIYEHYEMNQGYRPKRDKKIARSKRRLKSYISKGPGKRLLDVGCNLGFTVAAATELGLDAFGIDVDPGSIDEAKKQFGDHRFDCVDVREFAKRGETFDLIYTSEVIEHVPDPEGFVDALAKIANPNAVIYLTTPDAGHFRVPSDFVSWENVKPPIHILYFTKAGLTQLFGARGFGDIKFRFNAKPGIRMLARKL